MNSAIIALGVLVLGFNASAETTLHVPLFVEGYVKDQQTPVSEINRILIQKGLPAQPEMVVLSKTTKYEAFAEGDKITAVMEKAGLKNVSSSTELFPGQYNTGRAVTCYTGDASGVLDVVQSFVDCMYSDQYTPLGWRHSGFKWLNDKRAAEI